MDILFITLADKIKLCHEVTGSLILATKLLDAGFSTDLLRFGQFKSWKKDYNLFIKEITEHIVNVSPKYISFFTLCYTYHVVLRIACEVRKKAPDIKIIFGGPQATILAHQTMEAMPFIDYLCTDEGENTIVPFMNALIRCNGEGLDSIPGLLYRQNGKIIHNKQPVPITDLDTVPFWNKSLLLPQEGRAEPDITSKFYPMAIDAGRGCPYNCPYCSTSYFWKRRYRMKSPQRIIQDILYFNQNFGIRSFDFTHDAFTANQEVVTKICDSIIEKNLDIYWRCTTRIDCISEELILKMKQAGMYRISLGVETGSPRMQKIIRKNLDLTKIKPTIQFLLDNKIFVDLFFMYGFPEETPEDLQQTLSLAFEVLDMGIHKIKMHFCLFDPCTEITVKNYNALEFDPSINRVFMNIFGWNEEIEMIKNNKMLFSFYYNLDTPVRRDYQYLSYLLYLYEDNKNILKYIRSLYNYDDLAFYQDFYKANQHYLTDIAHMEDTMENNQTQMLFNLIDTLAPSNANQLKAWIELSNDLKNISESKANVQIQKDYNLNFLEFLNKEPFDRLSKATSTIVIIKTESEFNAMLLKIK